MSRAEGAAMRWSGAFAAGAAASVLVVQLVSSVVESKYCVLGPYVVLLLGCAAVLLSPAKRAVVVKLTQAVRKIVGAGRGLRWALARALRPCSSAGVSETEAAAVRRTGALLALAAESVLVRVLFPSASNDEHTAVLLVYTVFLLGCAVVLLSPAYRSVAESVRLLFSTGKASGGSPSRSNTVPRWTGFACIAISISLCANKPSNGDLLLFLPFLVGVWAIFMSMMLQARELPLQQCLRPTPPPAAEEGSDGGVVKVKMTPPQTASGVVASEV